MKKKPKTNKNLIIGIVVILIIGIYFGISLVSSNSDNVQKVTLSMRNYNYYPNTVTVKVNQPVEITLDSSVRGCFRNFQISGLRILKFSRDPSDKVEFIPTQKGQYEFACSMRMGTGTLIVE